MPFLTQILIGALFLLFYSNPALAEKSTIPTNDSYVTQLRGFCQISSPKKNVGFVATVQDICVHSVPRIYAQLGVDVDDQKFAPIQIVVVEHPKEMQRFVPHGAAIPTWSGAVAFPEHHLVLLPLLRRDGGPAGDVEVTLEHEISHLAFLDAGGGARAPRWFTEGVAILQSEGSSFHRKKSIWWASMLNDIEPLSDIAKYPKGAKAAEHAYAQAADFTAYLIDQEGWNGIRFLLSKLKAGEPFAAAFRQAYGSSVHRQESAWKEQLFGSLSWVMSVTSDAVWLGFGALICIVGFFVVRKRKHARLKEMEEEEAQLEQAIAAIDELIVEKPTTAERSDPRSATPVMDRLKKQRSKVEIDGKFHTLH